MTKGFVDEVKKLDELPFGLSEFGTGEVYEFSPSIKIPIYGSPTVEELIFIEANKSSGNQIGLMIDFAIFFIEGRTGIKLSKPQARKIPMTKLKELMDFFNSETKSVAVEDGSEKKDLLIGLPSTGDLGLDIPPTPDLTATNSGIAL